MPSCLASAGAGWHGWAQEQGSAQKKPEGALLIQNSETPRSSLGLCHLSEALPASAVLPAPTHKDTQVLAHEFSVTLGK